MCNEQTGLIKINITFRKPIVPDRERTLYIRHNAKEAVIGALP